MEEEVFIEKLKSLNLQVGDSIVLSLNIPMRLIKVVDQAFLDWLYAPLYSPSPKYPGHIPESFRQDRSGFSFLNDCHLDHVMDILITRKK